LDLREDWVWRNIEHMFEEDLDAMPTADLLESAAELRVLSHRAEARLLQHALSYADRFHPSAHPGRAGRRSCDGRERAVVLGGDGCPEILEFAIAEFGVMVGISPGVAADYLGQALGLRHRFPFMWARVLSGEATPWKACRIVADCRKLSEEAAARVDKRVAGLVDSITPARLERIIKAARMHVDADRARAEAAEKARERGVFVGQSNEHGTKTMFIKAAAGAVARNEATLAAIAEALKVFGDTRSVQTRRAEAVGIIADSRFTEELLTQARTHRLTNPQPDNTATPDTTTPDPSTPDPSTPDSTTPASSGVPDPTVPDSSGAPDPTMPDNPGLPDPTSADSAAADLAAAEGPGIPDPATPDTPCPTTPDSWAGSWEEPDLDDPADRDAHHPSRTEPPAPPDAPDAEPEPEPTEPCGPFLHIEPDDDQPMDAAAEQALRACLARIKHDAYANQRHSGTGDAGAGSTGTGSTGTGSTGANGGSGNGRGGGVRVRPGQTEIYVHLTDLTLATGSGVLRVESLGPMLAEQLAELVGYGPYTVKPVIDLNDAVSVDAYEIPDRIRERVRLAHPVEVFPFGTQETRRSMDLDHLRPYDPLGPPGQTSTTNLVPLGRYPHRVKTHAQGWDVRRVDFKTLEWSTPHGFRFHVDPTGTHRVPAPGQVPEEPN
jgi:hypothetical protein